ncbi:bifunctional 3'-5' exonuclease/ATP-dependent helicase WRN-like [Montipora foliosa]|uniref:bifunctional 3'-5' exonuclease/ATP-dependent helicase WRN-like n=1 Tax=Montipora foliosa TaxID=591990 RepID=UPI0035F20039
MYDQISSLREKAVQAAILGVKEAESDEDGDSPVTITCQWEGTKERIIQAQYEIVFSHPEAFLSCEDGLKVIQSTIYLSAVKAVIVDEAHCILEWRDDFRPHYGKLSVLAALFPNAPIAALTATATTGDRHTICNTLCLRNPKLVIANLNRPNVFFSKVFREGSDNEAYAKILQPIATSLLEQGTCYPLTLIYLPLPWCGRAYKLFEGILKEKQYDPEEGPLIPENRLFGQFHAPQTGKMKETILKELCNPDSKCRVVFATMALGMGVNISSVKEVIHIGPPRSVREYFQEAGRAGRDNKQSHAIRAGPYPVEANKKIS